MLKFISSESISIEYKWKSPEVGTPVSHRHIHYSQATPVYEYFDKWDKLKTEEKEIEGRLIEANITTRDWIIQSLEDNKIYKGVTPQNSNLSFVGRQLGKNYRFVCNERIEEQYGSGKEKKILELISYEILD